jgi:carbonic anhydrase/acetyltransferase-like protein (isoleucine patch superfamily)
LTSQGTIAPFGDAARDLPVGGFASLSLWQQDLFVRFGIEPVIVADASQIPNDSEAKIVVQDDVLFTRRVLKSFLQLWKKSGYQSVRLALPLASTFVESFGALQDLERTDRHALFDFWGVAANQSFDRGGVPLEVIYRERVIDFPVPERITGIAAWRHPITTSIVLHVRHWLHVLQANRLAIQIRWVDTVVRRPFWTAFMLLRALLFRRGSMLWRILGSANLVGKNVDIHPTARVEGSIVGDGAKIGAQALVRCSIVGEGSTVEERANVAYSVIGARTYVSKYTLVYSSVTMEGANVGASMQMCLVGRRAATTPRTTPLDVIPGQTIKVRANGRIVDSGLRVLGPCIGHDAFVGADTLVAPGRIIPNGTRIGPRPERVLAQIPEEIDPSVEYTVVDGKLTPL